MKQIQIRKRVKSRTVEDTDAPTVNAEIAQLWFSHE